MWKQKSKYHAEYKNNPNITISWSDTKDNYLLWINKPIGVFPALESAKRYFEKMEKKE